MVASSKDLAETSGDDVTPIDDGEKKGKGKLIAMILIPLLLLGGGGAGAYFTGMLDGVLGKTPAAEEGEAATAEGEEKSEEAAKDEPKVDKDGKPIEVAFLKIPDLIVNLNTDDGGPQRYLRLAVQLELASAADQAAVEKILPRVVDQFQTYLRELRIQDLRGSKGIYRLQIELLNRVNAAAAPVKVKDVLFQEILIQ